ncbi:MAG: DUF4279 domain-containing protein [Acidobacteriota bacterium]
MKDEANEVKVKLVVTSPENSHERVTRELGIEPTLTWDKGDRIGRFSRRKSKDNGWFFQVQEDGIEDTETLILQLLEKFKGRSSQLLKIHSDYEVSIEVVIFANSYMPHIGLSPEIARSLADLKLPINFDIYPLYGADCED